MNQKQKRLKTNLRKSVNLIAHPPALITQKGVSLIALVITIIVVIILAAIAFGTSTRTISNANYSDYVNNIGEVRTAFHTRAMTIKGEEAAKRK